MTGISSASFLETLLAELTTGIAIVDAAGVLQFANDAFCSIFGASAEELLDGQTDLDHLLQNYGPVHLQIRRVPIDGENRTLVLIDDRLENAELNRDARIFERDFHELSEQQQLAARMMQMDLMQMDRLMAAGTLASDVGHEINNPLSYLITNLGYASRTLNELQDGLTDGDHHRQLINVAEALDDATHGAHRIRDIVRRLRNLVLNEVDTFRPTALQPIIESALDMAANHVPHTLNAPAALPLVMGCPTRLAQAFLNFIINAAHAIEARPAQEHKIHVELREDKQSIVVEIRDTGQGIAPDVLPRIFDPFFTTKDVGRGTGLGLYICQQIVDAHRGRIEVESRPGQGTTFRVFLPC